MALQKALLLASYFCCVLSFPEGHKFAEKFPILMPRVRPTLPKGESYLCTSVKTDPNRTVYVREIVPRVSMTTAHHLMLIGCSNPDHGSSRNLWNCGGSLGEEGLDFRGACNGGNMQVLYMWSRNGSEIRFPDHAAFSIGGNTNINLLVLQVHYISTIGMPPSGDTSGVDVSFVLDPLPHRVGVMSLHVHGIVKPNGFSDWDAACTLPENKTIHPFAFLTHTHGHGVWASGWRVRRGREWTLIGEMDPQAPQSFYPSTSLSITPGDTLAARCTMESDSDDVILQGLTSRMEMCDYFIMYWTDEEEILSDNSCTTKANFTWENYGLRNLPDTRLFQQSAIDLNTI